MLANLMAAARRWARSPKGMWGLFAASFLETTVVPIPIEAVLVPMMLANRSRLWLIATVAFLGCIAGGVAGYAIGYLAYESAGQPLLSALGLTEEFSAFQQDFQSNGFWVIVAVGITPVPLQVATVGSGVAGYPLGLFVVAITIGRSIRYYGLALLARLFGRTVLDMIENHARTVRVLVLVLIAAALAYAVASYVT
jgi:membrane protein YqaA with SNARE-associated domain